MKNESKTTINLILNQSLTEMKEGEVSATGLSASALE